VIVIFVVMTRDVVSGYGTLVLIGSYDHVQWLKVMCDIITMNFVNDNSKFV
jgi:hypothetical protein